MNSTLAVGPCIAAALPRHATTPWVSSPHTAHLLLHDTDTYHALGLTRGQEGSLVRQVALIAPLLVHVLLNL